jgi:hypothetical protein
MEGIFIKMPKENYYRAIKVALFIGTLLNIINNYQAITTGIWTSTLIFKVSLTYCVPFCVSSYSSWKALKSV